ncbi:unnamed protein product [Calypogeia fissa]
MQTISIDMHDHMNPKPPRSSSTKKLSWPFMARSSQIPVCIQPSSMDLRPPWRTANPQSGPFEPTSRLLASPEWHSHKTIRACRQELFLQRMMRPSSAASSGKRDLAHCDCSAHWQNTRPSSAPAGGGGGGGLNGPSSKLNIDRSKGLHGSPVLELLELLTPARGCFVTRGL